MTPFVCLGFFEFVFSMRGSVVHSSVHLLGCHSVREKSSEQSQESPKHNRSFGYQAERGRRGGCIVWANYSETLPPPPRLRRFPRMSLTDLVSLTFKDESRTGRRNTHVQTHKDQWRPGTCVTTVVPPGWISTSLESWLVIMGKNHFIMTNA